MTESDHNHSTGRILAIGDIHGCDVALERLLAQVALRAADTVVILGDVVDRGPNSKGVIDRLLQLAGEVRLICIMGNHEEMLLDSLDRGTQRVMWLASGGMATLDSWGGGEDGIPPEHVSFLRHMRSVWETDTHIFSHACPDPQVRIECQPPYSLRWNKLSGEEAPHCSGKMVVCGHTSQASGRPAVGRGFICIDTKVYGGQWLTCLDVVDNLVWQARQSGEYRGPVPLEQIGRYVQ